MDVYALRERIEALERRVESLMWDKEAYDKVKKEERKNWTAHQVETKKIVLNALMRGSDVELVDHIEDGVIMCPIGSEFDKEDKRNHVKVVVSALEVEDGSQEND